MTAHERWHLLASQISDEVMSVTVDSRSYPGGTSYGIERWIPSRERLVIRDKWWKKNPDTWIGYQVHVESPEGYVRHVWLITKKRSEVVAAVRAAHARRAA